jgi:flagellar hook-basal body complex protein FliE
MADPLSISGLQSSQVGRALPGGFAVEPARVEGKSFKDVLMDSLNEVNRLQQEAAAGVEKVVTGETDNIAEVFTAVRKADVAFSMLMEMRNKLTDAYREIQQMRV